MRKAVPLILCCLLLMTVCTQADTVPGAGGANYRLTFYLDYHGCHLCNDKVVRIIRYLEDHATTTHVQYRAMIVRNGNPRRLRRWFKNYGLDIEPDFCEEKRLEITVFCVASNKVMSVDTTIDEEHIKRCILTWLQK